MFGINVAPSGLHLLYGDVAQSDDNYGIIIDSSRSSFRVFCDTVRLGHEYIEDYGDTLKRHIQIRNMSSLTASLSIHPLSQLLLEDNCGYLREITSLETLKELNSISSIASAYLKNDPLPSWFLHDAYQHTRHWVELKGSSDP